MEVGVTPATVLLLLLCTLFSVCETTCGAAVAGSTCKVMYLTYFNAVALLQVLETVLAQAIPVLPLQLPGSFWPLCVLLLIVKQL